MENELDEDLPKDALALLQSMEAELQKLEESTRDDVARVEEEARAAVARIESEARQQAQTLRDALEQQTRALRQRTSQGLKPMQDAYAREGKLDEALAIRAQIRALRPAPPARPQAAPNNMMGFTEKDLGKTFVFEVTGAIGVLWGTDVYTLDSSLAAAAIHAGVLRSGQRGVVRVTLVDTRGAPFTGSLRHELSSHAWSSYPLGYKVARGLTVAR